MISIDRENIIYKNKYLIFQRMLVSQFSNIDCNINVEDSQS